MMPSTINFLKLTLRMSGALHRELKEKLFNSIELSEKNDRIFALSTALHPKISIILSPTISEELFPNNSRHAPPPQRHKPFRSTLTTQSVAFDRTRSSICSLAEILRTRFSFLIKIIDTARSVKTMKLR
jgi:hypothetical protein